MVRKPQNSNDMNSKFEKVVRELRAKFRGRELHAKFRGGVLPWGRWFSRLRGVIRALDHTIWLHLRLTLMKGWAAIRGFGSHNFMKGAAIRGFGCQNFARRGVRA